MQILLKEVPTNGKPPSLERVQRDQLNTANQWRLQPQLQQINKHRLLRRPFPIQDVTLNVVLVVPLAITRPQAATTETLVHAHKKPAPIFGIVVDAQAMIEGRIRCGYAEVVFHAA